MKETSLCFLYKDGNKINSNFDMTKGVWTCCEIMTKGVWTCCEIMELFLQHEMEPLRLDGRIFCLRPPHLLYSSQSAALLELSWPLSMHNSKSQRWRPKRSTKPTTQQLQLRKPTGWRMPTKIGHLLGNRDRRKWKGRQMHWLNCQHIWYGHTSSFKHKYKETKLPWKKIKPILTSGGKPSGINPILPSK